MKRRRKLDAEEQELWSRVASTAVPMHPKRKAPAAPQLMKTETKAAAPKVEPIPAFRVGQKSTRTESRVPTTTEPPLKMDAKAFKKLGQGKLTPEARIDLHGMTVDEAHPALINFILRAHGKGLRLVLVITGKGAPDSTGPIPYQRGILRRQVPTWLNSGMLAGRILQTKPASRRHGGEGALYAYLRRLR